MMNILKEITIVIADVVAGAVALWALARAAVRDQVGALAMVNAWSGWLESVGLAAAGHSRFYRGQRRLGLVLLGLAGLRAWRALDWRLPVAAPPATNCELRLLSFNLLYRCHQADRYAAVIQQEQPDLIFLQELTPQIADDLGVLLGEDYPYRQIEASKGSNGYGILSRLPLGEYSFLRTPGGISRYAMRSSLMVEGRRIDLYNCHLMPPLGKVFLRLGPLAATQLRSAQIKAITDEVASSGRPAIVAGDCNLSPYQQTYDLFQPVLRDSWLEAGQGPGTTWPLNILPLPWATPPLIRIDLCWHTPELQAVRAHVVYSLTGSDHCPLVVDLAWASAQTLPQPNSLATRFLAALPF
jgi:endonuclease/exonuclease/phosphatase (EEP) superfamily protein YafD